MHSLLPSFLKCMVVCENYLVSISNVLTVSGNCTKLQLCPIPPIQSTVFQESSSPEEAFRTRLVKEQLSRLSGPHSSELFSNSFGDGKPPSNLVHTTH